MMVECVVVMVVEVLDDLYIGFVDVFDIVIDWDILVFEFCDLLGEFVFDVL